MITPTSIADFRFELECFLGDRVTDSLAVRDAHGKGESYHASLPADLVAFPESTEEVQRIVSLCVQRRMPIIPSGTGTSLEGHTAAPQGGLCLDMGRMDRVLEINVADMDCRVQPGVTRKALNAALRDTG